MNQSKANGADSPARMLESVTRTLRHEVGDLLQTVYSTVAILQERLPASLGLERRFLADLRARAEVCKDELDAAHDLVLPLQLSKTSLDLSEVAASLAAAASARHKSLAIRAETAGPLPVEADGHRLSQVGRLLLASACQSARRTVEIRTGRGPGEGEAQWTIADDGHGASPEQLLWLQTPFATTQQALTGLGLALARKVMEQHEGRVEVENRPGEGFLVRLILPRARPAERP
jgi:two-component system, NtrC family, nitrogen regulation sensor histidine kinase NtrY